MRLTRSLSNHLFLLRVSTAQSSLPNQQKCQENILAQTKEKRSLFGWTDYKESPVTSPFSIYLFTVQIIKEFIVARRDQVALLVTVM